MKDKKMGRSKPSMYGASSLSQTNPSSTSSSSVGKKVDIAGKDIPSEVKLKEMLLELRGMISDIQDERNKSEQTITSIGKIQDKISQERGRSASALAQLKSRLKQQSEVVYEDAEREFNVIKKALDQIEEIKNAREQGVDKPKQILRRGVLMSMLQKNAMTLPLWIGKPGEDPPPLCAAVQCELHHICKTGDKVAARVKSDDDAEENWILAEVVSFNSVSNKYDVDDIDAEEGKERHTLSKRRITPLPLWKADPEVNPEALFMKGALYNIAKDSQINAKLLDILVRIYYGIVGCYIPDYKKKCLVLVLALYPQTTCFYRALVHIPPSKITEDYSVLFEDTSYPNGYSPPLNVSQRYVISCKDDRKK